MCSSKVALIFLSTFVLSYTHKLIPRIVNGDLGSEGQFPYYAYLQMYKSDLTAAYRCGGALITSDFILTVAHCLKDIHHVNIFMGISHLYSSELAMETIIVNSNRLYIHPDYHKALTYKNDIGLIHLPRPVALSYHINPIELPSDCTSNENLDVMVMGFGRPEANEPFSHHLQYAKMKTISFTSCITEHPLLLLSRSIFNTQSQSIICAKPYEEKIQSVNGGDSGSPLVRTKDNTLIGLVSSGKRIFVTKQSAQLFTNILSHHKWISDITGLDLPHCQ